MSNLLEAGTRMGAVELLVDDLDATLSFYRDVLALDLVRVDGETHVLGRGGVETVTLTPARGLPRFSRSGAGLFHTAVLFETRAGLASAVARVAQAAPTAYTGSADHLVSQAFYFDDPEGNGVELYWDRPRDEWRRTADGGIVMGTEYIDANGFLQTHLTEAEFASPITSASVGHVHLQVGDIPTARAFYVDTLGFEEVVNMGSALFVAAGGYHHHVGLNTWNSRGAGPRAASLGLGTMDIVVPTPDAVGALRERLAFRGAQVADDGRTLTVADPWGSLVRVRAEA
jgi:catechol 2,3-dioxygenase